MHKAPTFAESERGRDKQPYPPPPPKNNFFSFGEVDSQTQTYDLLLLVEGTSPSHQGPTTKQHMNMNFRRTMRGQLKKKMREDKPDTKCITTCGREKIVQGLLCDKHNSKISQAIQISSVGSLCKFSL